MIEIIQGLPENIVAVIASGKVTQLGQNFTGFTSDAMWDDARVGIWHLTAFEKVAVVSDVDWIIDAVKIFKFVIPCPVKTFRNEEFPEAKAWIIE